MWFLFALVIMPIVEIALFIQVGQWIGLWPTIGLIILSGAAGLAIMRRQGLSAMNELRRTANSLGDPTVPIAHGALILLGGFLLLVPGFLSDVLGLSLLIPPVRRGLLRSLGRRVQVRSFATEPLGDPRRFNERPNPEPHRPGIIIDGDFEELDDQRQPPRDPSGWTRH